MDKLYSACQVAALCGVERRAVQNWCKKNSISIVGGAFILTEDDIARFKNRPKPGRPAAKSAKSK